MSKTKKHFCQIVPHVIGNLGAFFNVCNSLLKKDEVFWFRGNADFNWELTPSALRFPNLRERNKTLDLLSDFKRFGENKFKNPPVSEEHLKWVQLAQHYGLPTRLLDWTKNIAAALYFSCQKPFDNDGAVYILNPIDLNREVDPKKPRIFDANLDSTLINRYLRLTGSQRINGLKTIAIHPVWNSERIMLQQGVFTLHGSREFALTSKQAPSLSCLRILGSFKQNLLYELDRVGINEMAIFPEPEHMCQYLKWRENLIL